MLYKTWQNLVLISSRFNCVYEQVTEAYKLAERCENILSHNALLLPTQVNAMFKTWCYKSDDIQPEIEFKDCVDAMHNICVTLHICSKVLTKYQVDGGDSFSVFESVTTLKDESNFIAYNENPELVVLKLILDYQRAVANFCKESRNTRDYDSTNYQNALIAVTHRFEPVVAHVFTLLEDRLPSLRLEDFRD